MEPRDDGVPSEGMSWVRGSRGEPLLETTIPDLLAGCVAARRDATAAIFPGEGIRWTWAGFAARVDALAAGLARLGYAKGDRLGIWAPNRSEWLLTQFATARLGVILVTINPAYRVHELEYALTLSGCRGLVLAERFKASDYAAMAASLVPDPGATGAEIASHALPEVRHLIVMSGEERPAMLSGC